jgi:hypothetical protein
MFRNRTIVPQIQEKTSPYERRMFTGRTWRHPVVNWWLLMLLLGVLWPDCAHGNQTPIVAFDFASRQEADEWRAANHISKMDQLSDGLRLHIAGQDPYIHGPARDYPEGRLLWLRLRLKSDQGGGGQVFYYTGAPSEAKSVRFNVPAGQWHEVQLPMPALGAAYRLRIDPPGSAGTCILGRLWFEERTVFEAPAWPRPEAPLLGSVLRVESGDLKLLQDRRGLGSFEVHVAGQLTAIGNTKAMVGYVVTNQVRWMPLGSSLNTSAQELGEGFTLNSWWLDPDGARWNISTRCSPGTPGSINVETRVAVDQDRSVLYLPLLTLFPGAGSFGTNKNQGLFAGLEYLENEPSSSEADLIGPPAWRLVPDRLKLTFPLMAVQANDRYVGLTWEQQSFVSAVFDSPDRQFNSGGHLIGLVFPGSDGVNREERSLLPYAPKLIAANTPVTVRATLIGGQGSSVVPAVQKYVSLRGLPAIPQPGFTSSEYYELAARGWLESKGREKNLYRHAFWPGFPPQPASDAALWMLWLSSKVPDTDLGSLLSKASADALRQVAPDNYNSSQIGHIRYPLPSLVFGSVAENAGRARVQGEAILRRFAAPGTILYQPQKGGVDYGKTHWSREANGLTANSVLGLLEAAVFSGNRALIDAGLNHLEAMHKFQNSVPRGAQTWEIPLHTPDILASACLVRAYTLGYELTGDQKFLEQARYWAWTGVPFVYLTQPASGPVGIYGTIPVLGATSWVAPVWLGLPVQWCGLVYADALYRFVKHDPNGPWKKLADGIAVGGLQHTWPLTDQERKGLLPDFFDLRAQLRDGPAINPATVQVPAMRYFREQSAYEFHVFRKHGLRAHVPGTLSVVDEGASGVAFNYKSWAPQPCFLLVNGFSNPPKVKIDGRPIELQYPHSYSPADGHMIVRLDKDAFIEIEHRATR